MELKSMRLPPEPGAQMYPTMAEDRDEYGYGMRLCFQPPQMGALGMTEPPKVGETVMVQARAFVKSVSMDEGGMRMELQVTDAAVSPQAAQ